MSESRKSTQKLGRPRSKTAHQALLDTTSSMLETIPVRKITISAIAKQAGVGKPTIYRWWDSKCALIMDAYLVSATPHIPFSKTQKIEDALQNHIKHVIRFLGGHSGRIAAEMIGEGQSDPHILQEFRERFFIQLLAPPHDAIEQEKVNKRLDTDLDTDLILDLIYGPIYYRLLMGHSPLDEAFAIALGRRIAPVLRPLH